MVTKTEGMARAISVDFCLLLHILATSKGTDLLRQLYVLPH